MNDRATTVTVRGIELTLVTYNRALELCARMNYETEVLDFIDGIPENGVFFDLGACEGRFALYAALKGIRTYAFEPEQSNFDALLQNRDLNSASAGSRLLPYRLAVGERTGKATLKIGQPWAGGHQKVVQMPSSRVDPGFDFAAEQEIDIVGLDAFVERERLPFPTHIKVDVDGSELPFVMGAQNTLRDPRLKSVIFELCKTDEKYSQITGALQESGLAPVGEFEIPNNPDLYNIVFGRSPRTATSEAVAPVS
jgi:FkbM family methyltransferase